jgi:transposase-like protein
MTINQLDASWINVVKTYHKCPRCKSGLLDTRIKRGFFVRNVFIWMNVKRYQCNACGRKSYVKAHKVPLED